MEPNDLKSTPPDDTQLEAWLRSSASLPPLPDDGFSRRVLTALPPPARRSSRRPLFCVAGALAGLAVALGSFLSPGHPLARLPEIDALLVASLEKLAQPAVGLALGVTLLSLAYVFWQDMYRAVRL